MSEVETGTAQHFWNGVTEINEELIQAFESGLYPTVYYRAGKPRKAYHKREQRGAGIVVRCISVDVPRLRNTDHKPGHVSEAYTWDLAQMMWNGGWRPCTPKEVEEFEAKQQEKRREMELENLRISRKRSLTIESLENAGALPQPLAPGQQSSYSAVINGVQVTVASFAQLQQLLAQQPATATTPATPKATK